jgi:hypothetical protein
MSSLSATISGCQGEPLSCGNNVRKRGSRGEALQPYLVQTGYGCRWDRAASDDWKAWDCFPHSGDDAFHHFDATTHIEADQIYILILSYLYDLICSSHTSQDHLEPRFTERACNG